MLNFYSYLYLSCAALVLISCIMVLRHNPRNPLNQKYALLCAAILVWVGVYGFAVCLEPTVDKRNTIFFLFKFSYTGIIFIPITFADFILEFFEHRYQNIIFWIGYFVTLIFAVTLWATPNIIENLYSYPWGVYPKAGPWHPYFLMLFMLSDISAIIFTIRCLKRLGLNKNRKIQIRHLVISFIFLSSGSIDFIPNYGINIYPIGCITTSLFILIIGYGILKYQLMDITIVIRRGTVYSLMVTAMTLIYFLIIVIFEKFLQNYLGYRTFIGSILASLILAVIFVPLRNRIQLLVDRFILGKAPADIADENSLLQTEILRREKYKLAANLAGNVAHEIKNPLTAIQTFLQEFPAKKDQPDFQKFHPVACAELSRIQRLSAQLMHFAKPSELKIAQIDIYTLINDVLMLSANRLKKAGIDVVHPGQESPMMIRADADQLKQVLLNLVLNAIDAMSEGGVLTVEVHGDWGIGVRDLKENNPHSPTPNHLTIKITDTGTGIAPEHLKRLFEPFFTTKDNGTGLGLNICKRIIAEHKGTIQVQSEPGKGTTFTIRLPMESEPPSASPSGDAS